MSKKLTHLGNATLRIDGVSLNFRPYTHVDFAARDARFAAATKEMYDRVREKALSEIKAHIDWVVSCAIALGYEMGDLQLIVNGGVGITTRASIVDKRTTVELGWAEAAWLHDELQVTKSSIYGTEPEDPA